MDNAAQRLAINQTASAQEGRQKSVFHTRGTLLGATAQTSADWRQRPRCQKRIDVEPSEIRRAERLATAERDSEATRRCGARLRRRVHRVEDGLRPCRSVEEGTQRSLTLPQSDAVKAIRVCSDGTQDKRVGLHIRRSQCLATERLGNQSEPE